MPPFTLAMLPGESLHNRRRRNAEHLEAAAAAPDAQDNPDTTRATHNPSTSQPHTSTSSSRPTRHRPTSHYNVFQTTCLVASDSPPSYAVASRARPQVARSLTEGCEPLPSYSCTVGTEAKILLSLESANPLSRPGEGEWREVYMVLRGTLLSFHRVKDGGAGKLLRAYTLQHAEVGLATDSQHTILVPQSRFANLVPHSARRRAWQKDPGLFKAVDQSLLRLRVETDQILLADSSEERIQQIVYSLGAAIDIAQVIDERSIPKQCTVPRRRRRPRAQFSGDLTDPVLVAEQERIMRQMYPGLTGVISNVSEAVQAVQRPVSGAEIPIEAPADAPSTPAREEEEIDFSMIREENAAGNIIRPQINDGTVRPSATRQTTSTTIASTFSDDMVYATPMSNFDDHGKWRPPHHRTAVQVQRYVRRCMPVLLADASRASDIVISNGKRMKINWRMELLEEWELQPPSYKAHKFPSASGLARTCSQRSASESANAAQQSTSSINTPKDDQIMQAEQGLNSLQLSKMLSASTGDKGAPAEATLREAASMDPKGRTPQQLAQDIDGVVFCF